MHNFKQIDEHYSFQLDNRQIAYLGTGVLALFLLFFLLGVLYGGRLGVGVGPLASPPSALTRGPETAEGTAPAPPAPGLLGRLPKEAAPSEPNEKVFELGEQAMGPAEAQALRARLAAADMGKEPPHPPVAARPAAAPAATEPAPRPPAATPAPPPQPHASGALRGRTLSAMMGPYTIQVGSFTRAGDARRLAERLGQRGYPVFLARGEVRGQSYYRVRVGRFESREQALEEARRFERFEKLETYVTRSQ